MIIDSSDRPDSPGLDARRGLYERFGPAHVAVSTDGREVHFSSPVDSGLRVGGLAVVEGCGEGPDLAVQIRSIQLVELPGPELQVSSDLEVAGDRVTLATVRPLLRAVTGTAALIGSYGPEGFRCHDSTDPFGERIVRRAHDDEIRTIVQGLTADRAVLTIGVHEEAPEVPASLVSTGFARHTFMCGQSGSGKTYTTGVVFERLLAGTALPIVILDPNSDHVHLGTTNTTPDGSDESPEQTRFADAAASVRVARARGLGGDHVLCADFSDLSLEWQALLLRLHPLRDADEFDALRRITESLVEPYSVDDVMAVAVAGSPSDPLASSIVTRIRNLGVADWDVWRREGESSMSTANLRDERCVVFDLGSLSRPDERTAVALAVLGSRWRERHERQPVLIAIDEAHNLFPAITDDPLLQATTELGVLIAGEGRKFGLQLFVATQRPRKVHPNITSQCDNLVLMRMNGARDVDELVDLFSHVPAAMVRAALGFGLGRALVAGPLSPVPMVVKVGRRFSPEGGSDVPTTWASPNRRGDR